MKFKAYTGITWSLLELTGLLENEDSRVSFEKVKKHFGLHPFHLTNIHTALNEILSSNLNSYDPELKGFLLAYKNPKLLTSLGEIFYDTCFIHIDVEADFYIFRPQVGCSLTGIVNKKGLSHIGLLVHKAFNISVPKPDGEDNWPGDSVEIGQEVRVHVTNLDCTSRLPFIRGILDKDDYLKGCKLPEPRESTSNKRLSICEYDESEDITSSQESSIKGKPRPFFTSDSEDSLEEEAKPLTKRKQAKKEKQLTKDTSLSIENDVEQKKSKKSKRIQNESRVTIPEQDEFNNMSTDNDNDIKDDRIYKDVSAKKSKSKSKSAKKSVEPVVNDTIKTLKEERERTSSSSENVLDEDEYIRKIKKEKSSNVARQSDISDAEVSIWDSKPHSKTPSTKPSKKTKLSKVESEDVYIKDENLVASNEEIVHKKKRKKNKHNETKEEIVETQLDVSEEKLAGLSNSINNHDASINDSTDQVPKKKRSKKHKKLDQDEEVCNTSRKEAVKTEAMDSTAIDGSTEIPVLNIKTERVGSYDSISEKKSQSKRSSEPATIANAAIMKIKKERSVSVSGSENATEDEKSPKKMKGEKRSKNKKQLYDAAPYDTILERSMESPEKRTSKKRKISESATESITTSVKHENCIINNVTHSENSDGSQANPQSSPKKKKSKKQKLTEEENETDNNDYQNVTIKSEFANSSGFNLSSEIPMMDIKQEKIQSGDEIGQNEYNAKFKTPSAPNTNSVEPAFSSENAIKKKKKKKNKDKDLSDSEILNGSFEVMVKTERLDSSSITIKNEVKESLKKETHAEGIEITVSEEEVDSETRKKNFTPDVSTLPDADIKVEESSNENWKRKESRKTSKSSHREEKLNKKSARSHSENAHSDEYCNTKIKVEKDS